MNEVAPTCMPTFNKFQNIQGGMPPEPPGWFHLSGLALHDLVCFIDHLPRSLCYSLMCTGTAKMVHEIFPEHVYIYLGAFLCVDLDQDQ